MHTGNLMLRYTLLTVLLITGTAFAQEQPCASSDATGVLAQGNNAFTIKLYQQLSSTEGNLFFSPYSIRSALAMTYAGARGRTAEQMKSALNFTLPDNELHTAFAASIRALNTGGKDNYELTIANRLWGDITCIFRKPFRDTSLTLYDSTIKKVDFINASESARIEINNWVEEKTNDKIMDLIPPGGVNQNTRLALINAVYFKGLWSEQFDKKQTRDEPFHLAGGKTKQVPLMRFTEASTMPFFAGDGIKIVELGYRGDDISMVIILPDRVDGLAALETQLNEFQLKRWLDRLEKRPVKVLLPRFTLNWGAKNLVPDLRALGMRDAFIAKTANFSGIDGTRDLLISNVFHKSFIDVNEEGTEAAAATGVLVGVTSMPPPPETFRADHPFLFLIREKASGNILFMGRMAEPATN
jgi:serpin B